MGVSPAIFCRICRKFFSNFNQNIPLGEYRPAQAAGHRSGRTTAKAGHARSHFRTALQDQAARCSLHVFSRNSLYSKSGPCPLPLPNRFAKSSRRVLAARYFTKLPIQQKTHQASNLGELWWLKTDSNHRPAGYEMSMIHPGHQSDSHIFSQNT